MKKIEKLIAFIAITTLLFSCTNDEQVIDSNQAAELNQNDSSITGKSIDSYNTVYSTNSLVIQFASGIDENQKQNLRDFYEVSTYQLCDHCANNKIELWLFEDGIDIEPKKTTIEIGLGNDGIQYVEYQFNFDVSSTNLVKNNVVNYNSTTSSNYFPYIKDQNYGVTIAVFDTGIDPEIDNGNLFQNQFLYNASNDGIPGIYSGWDFVNHDDDCFDDNYGSHGSAVTSIITNILNSNQYLVPHQILPLKICNQEGQANYFNFLCATSYALERAEILQMSLGWYNNNSGNSIDNIFLNLMSQYPNAVIISSAGNEGTNNDAIHHYPSGYTLENIIAVASCNQYAVNPSLVNSSLGHVPNISWFSNYGHKTVDYFANGEGLYFLGQPIEGTSFAAPKVTAMIAKLKFMNPNIPINQIITILNSSGLTCQSTFDTSKKVLHNKILIP